ncbi:MAG TPA: SDR family NAD(P)-dependent oxidoreductase [Alphaproteobacteria bacterium]|nr:SDR family NAD(P)-dependent oxidoreductase [Alphaproteobacteria bacterium]
MEEPRSILITGASSGLGAALARLYAGPGVHLALTGRNSERLDTVARACREHGAEVLTATLDVTERAALAGFLAQADSAGPLDLVIANAGIDGWGLEGHERYYRTFEVNVTGVLNTVLPAIDLMLPRRRGQLALMGSLAGYRGMATAPAYSTSKAAVRALGEALRGRLARDGIAVSVITPGFVATPMTEGSKLPMPFRWPAERAARHIRRRLARNQGRIAFPWQLYTAVWLISAMPSWLADRLMMASPRGKY